MAGAFVQQAESSTGASVGLNADSPSMNIGSAHLLVLAISYNAAAELNVTLTDGGVGNTFVELPNTHQFDSTVGVTTGTRYFYVKSSVSNATTVFRAAFDLGGIGQNVAYRCIAVAEYSGVDTTAPLLDSKGQQQINPAASTDSVSSTAANATAQPAMVIAFTNNYIDNGTTSAGTGYTGHTKVWDFGGSSTKGGLFEDKRITSTGNNTATFTPTTATDSFHTMVAIFQEPGAGGGSPNVPQTWQTQGQVGVFLTN